jgi:ElaB/YqjD/DUF883 family membrane-anchored ribosome-binding protein
MSDETIHDETTPDSGQPKTGTDESWKEVGKQFENLGATLAQALRTTWSKVESNSDAQQVKAGLEALLRDVGKAVEDAVASPDGQKLKEDVNRTAQSLRTAGEQTIEEARPQIISALKQVNDELQKLIQKVENH